MREIAPSIGILDENEAPPPIFFLGDPFAPLALIERAGRDIPAQNPQRDGPEAIGVQRPRHLTHQGAADTAALMRPQDVDGADFRVETPIPEVLVTLPAT